MIVAIVWNKKTCGIASYNFKNHVASDIAIGDSYLPSENCHSQDHLDSVQEWTTRNKMKLNKEKTKAIIFNFTLNYQFSTRLHVEESLIEIVQQTKLLGCIITSDLTWWENTNSITKKAYQRLEILRKLYEFKVPISDLSHIYTLYVRSILEFNCCVWNFSITEAEVQDIERVQKVACRIILKESFTTYDNALSILKLVDLKERRKSLCLKFAQNCLKFDKSKDMFPENNTNQHSVRSNVKYKVNFASTSRLLYSAIPQMQRLLNQNWLLTPYSNNA